MSTLIKLRRDTAANWAATDPVLALGEPGYDTTNNELRIGDGTSAWSSLTPIAGGGGGTYGDANVATLLSAFGSNAISTTGNVTAGYFVGDGSQLTNLPGGGNVSLPLSNGTSNFDIATADGNVTITANGTSTWTFDTTGNLITSSNLLVGPSPAGGSSILQYDSTLQVVGEGANAIVVMGWAANTSAPDSIAVVGFNTPYTNGASNVQIAVGNNATVVNYWNFDGTGNLTLPQGGIITEGPSPSYLGNAVTITPASGSDADQQLKIYPTFAEGNHLHLTTGNLYNTEMYVGDDNLYVKLANTGEVMINSNDNLGNTAHWTFAANGNLILPPDAYINTPEGSHGDILFHPDGNGKVVISGNTSSALLQVIGDEPNSYNRVEVDTFGNGAIQLGGTFSGRFNRGTFTVPEAVLNNDRLAQLTGSGYDGSDYSLATGRVTFEAVGNWSGSNHGTRISFYTTPLDSTTLQLSARIFSTGDYHQIIGNVVVESGVVITNTYTVSSLPSATAGARSFVTDADTRTWGNLAVGGAGNTVPVWSDGSSWYIG